MDRKIDFLITDNEECITSLREKGLVDDNTSIGRVLLREVRERHFPTHHRTWMNRVIQFFK